MTIVTTSPSVALRHPIILWIAQLRAWVFLAFLVLFFEVWARATEGTSFLFNVYNIQSILVFATAPLLLALGQTFVIISAGIDLSLGFVMGLSSVIAAHGANFFTAGLGLPPFLAMLGAILCGMAIAIIPGLVNGLLVSRLQIPPFIGTLGMYGVARGAAYLFAGGMTVAIDNDWYSAIGNGRVFGVPVLVIITGVACLVLHYILSQTRFGQHTYALGASKPAANRAGIDVKWLTLRIYLLSAVMAGVAGAMYTGRFTAGAPQAGEPLLLELDRGRGHWRREPVRRFGHDRGHDRRRARHRGHPVRSGLHQCRAVLAVHRRRRCHHHLGVRRPDSASPHRRTNR